MRLLTWNLSNLDVTDAAMLQDPRVSHLASLTPDLLCLQKISGEARPEGLDSGFTELADHLGMTGVLGCAAEQKLHVAVLWRAPLTGHGHVVRRAPDSQRNYLFVDLVVDGQRMRVGSIHLPSSSVEDQLHDLRLLLPHTDDAAVLAGDWNATGADESYDVDALPGDDRHVAEQLDALGLADGARLAAAPWEPTWRTTESEPFVRIDGVRLGAAWAERVDGYRVHSDVDHLSLHRPVELTLT